MRLVEFSPDGSIIVSADDWVDHPGGPAIAWDAATREPIGEDFAGSSEEAPIDVAFCVLGVAFRDDGSTLITTGRWTIRRWDIASGGLLSSIPIRGLGDPDAGFVRGSLPIGDELFVAGDGALAVIGNVSTGRLHGEAIKGQAPDVTTNRVPMAVSPDRATLAMGGQDGIVLWSLNGQQLLTEGLPSAGSTIAFMAGNGRWLVGENDGPNSWDLSSSGSEPRRFGRPEHFVWIPFDRGRVFGVGRVDTPEFQTEVFDPETLTTTGVITEIGVTPFAAHADRGWLAADNGNALSVFDLDTGSQVAEVDVFGEAFSGSADFNPEGTRLIAATSDGDLAVIDTETWQPILESPASEGDPVVFVRHSPAGDFLATSEPSGRIAICDPETLERIGDELVGHAGGLNIASAFNPDGTRLLSIGEDGTIILWDVPSRSRLADSFPTGDGTEPAGLPDGRATTIVGDHILLWNLNTDEWYDIACRAAGRNLTRAEWEEFGPADVEYTATCPQWPVES